MTDVLDSLYTTFARVPRPRAIESCPHCYPVVLPLLEGPVRDLPAGALLQYGGKVLFTVGHVADYKYFLPRLLEIAWTGEWGYRDLSSTIGRLRLAGWTTWPADEQAAIRGFLHFIWTRTLAADPGELDAGEVLEAIAGAEDDLGPYLAELAGSPAQVEYLITSGTRVKRGVRKLPGGYWDQRPDQAAQVLAWLAGTAERISR